MAHLTVRGSAPIEWISEPTVHDIAQLLDDDVHLVDVRIVSSSSSVVLGVSSACRDNTIRMAGDDSVVLSSSSPVRLQ